MDEADARKFKEARQQAEEFYKTIGKVKCPYFKEDIAFNVKGLKHLKFKSDRQARSHQDQYIRFRLLPMALRVIQDSHTLQGVSQRKNLEFINRNSRWEKVVQPVTYYEFVAVINDCRFKVIVKQVSDNPKYFWSVIPFWKTDKITGKRLLHGGKPETD